VVRLERPDVLRGGQTVGGLPLLASGLDVRLHADPLPAPLDAHTGWLSPGVVRAAARPPAWAGH